MTISYRCYSPFTLFCKLEKKNLPEKHALSVVCYKSTCFTTSQSSHLCHLNSSTQLRYQCQTCISTSMGTNSSWILLSEESRFYVKEFKLIFSFSLQIIHGFRFQSKLIRFYRFGSVSDGTDTKNTHTHTHPRNCIIN